MATLSSLLPYFYTTMAQIIVLKRLKVPDSKQSWFVLLAIFAGAYAIWTILGSGATTVFYGVILMLSSIPIYAWTQWSSNKKSGMGAIEQPKKAQVETPPHG